MKAAWAGLVEELGTRLESMDKEHAHELCELRSPRVAAESRLRSVAVLQQSWQATRSRCPHNAAVSAPHRFEARTKTTGVRILYTGHSPIMNLRPHDGASAVSLLPPKVRPGTRYVHPAGTAARSMRSRWCMDRSSAQARE